MDGAGGAVGGPVPPARGPTTGDPSSARSPHRLSVVTPEGVVLEFRAAGVGSRMLAAFLDIIIQLMALVAVIIAVAVLAVALGETAAIVSVILALFAIFFGYPVLFETLWGGRTPGKAVLGIRVITAEGAPVGFRHSAIRAMLSTVDYWFPAPGGLVALTSALVTARSQRLGDLVAGTIVVRRPRNAPAPVFFAPVHGAEDLTRVLDTSALTPAQYAVIRDYLLRARELAPGAAWALGEELSARVAALTATARPPWLDAERHLVAVLAAHQARFRPATPPPPAPGAQPVAWWPGGPGPALVGAASLAALPPPQGPPVVGVPGR